MQKDLTIVIVDSAYHELAAKAIDQTLEVTKADSVLVLSDRDFYPGSKFVKIDPIQDKRHYSYLMLKELGKHIEKDNFMVIQYDGMPIDADKWQDEFLNYDYIGASWPWGPANRRVGNGGFCLRSRRLSDLCLDDRMVFDPPGYGDNNYTEDTHIALLYRDWLESEGITYAPLELANEFSAENPGGRFPTYGFHGTLCLPFYLSDDHLEFYINHLTPKMLTNDVHIRILFGLFRAERYEHLEQFMDRAVSFHPNFKEVLLKQFPQENHYYPEITLQDLEQLLSNY
jgi:Protein of unknown function (DUF5672)